MTTTVTDPVGWSTAAAVSVTVCGPSAFESSIAVTMKSTELCSAGIVTVVGTLSSLESLVVIVTDSAVDKFFPAEAMGGVKTLKAFHGPYRSIRFMPTGGVSAANLLDYLNLPYVIACGGSWMVKSDLIADGRFDEITRVTAETMQLVGETNS